MDFYTKIYAEKEMALWKIAVGVGIFIFATAVAYSFSDKGNGLAFGLLLIVAHMLAAAISYAGVVSGHVQLNRAYHEFCEHRIIPLGRSLHARYPTIQVVVPRRKVFYASADPRVVEKRMLGYLRDDQKREEQKAREQKLLTQCERLKPELAALAASSGLTDEERQMMLGIGAKFRSPEAMRRFIVKLRTLIAHDTFVARMAANSSPQPINAEEPQAVTGEDRRLLFLEAQAENCVSGAARVLYERALEETDRRARIRLFKQAIHAEQRASRKRAAASSTQSEPSAPRAKNDVRYIELNETLENRFGVAHLIPRGVDAAMAKEILIVLLEPGKLERRFQNSYRTESRIKRRVMNRYAAWIGEPFDQKQFRDTLGWFVRDGILRTKPKGTEPVYSLSANTREAKNERARALIAAVLQFDHDIRHGQMW